MPQGSLLNCASVQVYECECVSRYECVSVCISVYVSIDCACVCVCVLIEALHSTLASPFPLSVYLFQGTYSATSGGRSGRVSVAAKRLSS